MRVQEVRDEASMGRCENSLYHSPFTHCAVGAVYTRANGAPPSEIACWGNYPRSYSLFGRNTGLALHIR
jgi:hypothetical protein